MPMQTGAIVVRHRWEWDETVYWASHLDGVSWYAQYWLLL